MGDFNTQGLANTAWALATAGQLLGKDLAFTPATELLHGKKRPPRESEQVQTVLKYQKELEEAIPRHKFVKSVDHSDFKRLRALQRH